MSVNKQNKWIICRICLKHCKMMVGIFESCGETQQLAEKIEECGGISLDTTATLPDKICSNCLLLLKAAEKFRTLCRRSQIQLCELLQLQTPASRQSPKKDKEEGTKNSTRVIKQERESTNDSESYQEYVVEDNEVEVVCDDGVMEANDCEFIALPGSQMDFLEDDSQQNGDDTSISYNSNEQFEIIKKISEGNSTEDEGEFFMYGFDEDNISNNTEQKIEIISKHTLKIEEVGIKSKKTARGHTGKNRPNVKTNRRKDHSELTQMPTFVCCHCGNIYSERSRFTLHMKIHTKEKPHECEICHKRFAQTPQLARHMNSHTGSRPFKCKFCDSCFADPSTRIKHQRIHTNERPYKCDTCGKSFSYSNVLKVHIMTHTGEKPYMCDFCGKKFSQLHHKKTHERTHNPDVKMKEEFIDSLQ